MRNREGIIFKVDEEKKNIQINEFMNMRGSKDILKHSKNIIDLIEEGDYVNGYRVDEVRISSFNSMLFCNDYHIEIQEYQIKSIVTKEQFKSVEYEVK